MKTTTRALEILLFSILFVPIVPSQSYAFVDVPRLQDSQTLELIERGDYLVKIGNCQACHTARGDKPFSGGREISTEFGNFYTPNITPDVKTGIGDWSQDDFWQAMQLGKRPNGEPLYPSFPYTSYSKLTREDVNAIYAYLRTVPPVKTTNRPHDLRFPFNFRSLVSVWQYLYFKPETYRADDKFDMEWNRGRYLVNGVGHCNECHQGRTGLGNLADPTNSGGGSVLNWYAPSLYSNLEAGLQDWPLEAAVELLKSGKNERASFMGPMAEVTSRSLLHLTDADARAMARYLKSMPQYNMPASIRLISINNVKASALGQLGGDVYVDYCQDCHGKEGVGAQAGPTLAGNRAVQIANPTNLINVLYFGGYPASTPGNSRPYGMPPFGEKLTDREIAAVLTFIRQAWGNQANPISPADVARNRKGGPLW